MSKYVIGDIHGMSSSLEEILSKAPLKQDDTLIFLGDYVDGGPDSKGVIEILIRLKYSFNCIFIRGNHDDWASGFFLGGDDHGWSKSQGLETVASYKDGIPIKHKEFFKNLIPYYIDSKNRGFVHGGFTSKYGLGHEPYVTNYYWDRDMWSLARLLESNKYKAKLAHEKRFKKHKEIFIGHTTTLHYGVDKPMKALNVWNLDTGVKVPGGRLTIMNVKTKEFWQSKKQIK